MKATKKHQRHKHFVEFLCFLCLFVACFRHEQR